jgi:hypothetical protein
MTDMSNPEIEPVDSKVLPWLGHIDDVDVLTSREGGLHECVVPMSRIEDIDAPLDERKLEALRQDLESNRSRRGGSGQKSPVRLGYVIGEAQFRVIDGFHRFATLRELGDDQIYATVEQVDLEELLDDRIRNANMHEGIKFARMGTWMHEVWALSPFADKLPNITSAFSMAHFHNDQKRSGKNLGLTPEDAEAIVAWARAKAEIWGTTVITVYNVLQVSSQVAPELVQKVRHNRRGSPVTKDHVNQATVTALAARLADRHEHQRLVLEAARMHGLSTVQIKQLSTEIAPMSPEEARQYLMHIEWVGQKGNDSARLSYSANDLVRLGLIRGSSPIEPLLEVARLTATKMETGSRLDETEPVRLVRLRQDLGRVAGYVSDMIEIVSASLGDEPEGIFDKHEVEVVGDPQMSVIDYLTQVGAALEADPSEIPMPQDAEQCEAILAMLEDEDIAGSVPDDIKQKLLNHISVQQR